MLVITPPPLRCAPADESDTEGCEKPLSMGDWLSAMRTMIKTG